MSEPQQDMVYYSYTRQPKQYESERFGISLVVAPGEDPSQAFERAKKLVRAQMHDATVDRLQRLEGGGSGSYS